MISLKINILLAFSLLIFEGVFSQDKTLHKYILQPEKIGKKIITKDINKTIFEKIYLGKIHDTKGKVKYYVVSEFIKVKAAIVYHGHSNIIFFDKDKKKIAQVIVGMPEDLPFQLDNNCLLFKYIDSGNIKIFKQEIGDHLPKIICNSSTSCNEIIYE